MSFPRPILLLLRIGVPAALAILWVACGGNVVAEPGQGGGATTTTTSGTTVDICCPNDPNQCIADCVPGDCATGDFCDTCTVCQGGVRCMTDADCPSGATCGGGGFDSGLCATGASCTSNADCPAGSACDGTQCLLTQP